MEEYDLEGDLKYIYSVLEEMHEKIMSLEPLPHDLKERAKESIYVLENWEVSEARAQVAIEDTIEMLKDELAMDKEIKKVRSEHWKHYLKGTSTAAHKI